MKQPPYRFVVRLPIELRDRISEASRLYRRSMNSEIVARLDQSLSGLPNQVAEAGVEPPFFEHIETTFRGDLSSDEDDLIRTFRRLSDRQREALLMLLEG